MQTHRQQGDIISLLSFFQNEKNRIKFASDTIYIFLFIRLTSLILFWKENRLLLDKPILVFEYRTAMKSVTPITSFLTKSIFRVLSRSAIAVIFLKMPDMHFQLGRVSINYQIVIKLVTNISEKIVFVFYGPSEGTIFF
jgi:hypothetical protein